MREEGQGGDSERERGTPREIYRRRRRRFAEKRSRAERRSLVISWSRLVTATLGLVSMITAVATASGDPAPWILLTIGAVAVFLGLVVVHEKVHKTEERWKVLMELQDEGLARLDRDWDRLPVPGMAPPPERRSLARDLQLFGRASVAHLLGTVQSPPGRRTLIRWLLSPAAPEEIRERQEAVRGLVPAIRLRHRLAREGRDLGELEPEVEDFLDWAEGGSWTENHPVWLWTARSLPALAWISGLSALMGWTPAAVPLALFVLSFGMANLLARPLSEAHDRISAREREMGAYAATLRALWSPEAETVRPALRDELRKGLEAEERPAWRHLESLQRRLDLADVRYSGSLRFVLNTLFLWDVHTLWLLEEWQAGVGSRVRGWLERQGELEALSALATLAFEEPEWSFPRVDPSMDRMIGHDLAHPLLPASTRVANDVTVGPPDTVLLVTGSNMSGKSTLLRAIGVNVVLAQAGGPVCAAGLELPPSELATSVLVEDSLEEGISFFMAEVLRVREVMEAAEEASDHDRRLLFLLDEILRGTNSADRRVAVREVLSRLVELGAIGAVSTHDLALAEDEAVGDLLIPVHFRETIHPGAEDEEPPMTFDYRLRPGVAPTTNALQLLEMFGLPS